MKKNIFNFLILILLVILAISIILFSNNIIQSIIYSFEVWKNNIFTTLFPFFIISDLLMNYGFIDIIGELNKKITTTVFHLPKESSFVIISSILSGTPSSAKYTKELLDKGLISIEDANHILTFTHFPNPIFVLGVVSKLLNSNKIGFYILISIVIGNIIVGILFRGKIKQKKEKINIKNCIQKISIKNNSFIKILSEAILKSIDTLLLLLGIITFFFIITTIIDQLFNISPIINSVLSGILEITQGIKKIAALSISIHLKATIITFFLSFGGLSIHSQTLSILDNKDIKYNKYIFARIIHSIISCLIIQLLSLRIPC